MTYEYKLLDVAVSGRVATVTISNPPVNVITLALLAELEALSHALKADPDLTVVVFRSADPDFFLAHFDVAAILQRPTDTPARRDTQIKPYHAMCERYRTMDKVVISITVPKDCTLVLPEESDIKPYFGIPANGYGFAMWFVECAVEGDLQVCVNVQGTLCSSGLATGNDCVDIKVYDM